MFVFLKVLSSIVFSFQFALFQFFNVSLISCCGFNNPLSICKWSSSLQGQTVSSILDLEIPLPTKCVLEIWWVHQPIVTKLSSSFLLPALSHLPTPSLNWKSEYHPWLLPFLSFRIPRYGSIHYFFLYYLYYSPNSVYHRIFIHLIRKLLFPSQKLSLVSSTCSPHHTQAFF